MKKDETQSRYPEDDRLKTVISEYVNRTGATNQFLIDAGILDQDGNYTQELLDAVNRFDQKRYPEIDISPELAAWAENITSVLSVRPPSDTPVEFKLKARYHDE